MRKIRLTCFGKEILCLEVERDDLIEADDDEDIAVTREDVAKMVDQIDTNRKKIAGGQNIETERDLSPLIPGLEKDYDSWADRPFGFNKPRKSK